MTRVVVPLANLTVPTHSRCIVTWTVIQVPDSINFLELFENVIAGRTRLQVDELILRSSLQKVFVGLSKDSMSVVDELLDVAEVCASFGRYIKFVVQLQSDAETECTQSQITPLRNAFSALMETSSRAMQTTKLPSTISVVRTKKDQLYNDLIGFLQKNRWEWTTGGESHGKRICTRIARSPLVH